MPTAVQTSSQMKIISGPSREELFDALRLYDEDRWVIFGLSLPLIKGPVTREVRVQALSMEDGSGQCWLVDGLSKSGATLHGFYRTDQRNGYFDD